MSDLINRQQAIDVLEEQLDYLFMLNKKDNPTAESKWYGINWARNTIAELPNAEPKVGEWKAKSFHECFCDNCGFSFDIMRCDFLGNMKHCPNCGAKMERSE